MRYQLYEQVKEISQYDFYKHIINSYYCINEKSFDEIVNKYADNPLVQVCGKTYGNSYCKNCGNCEKNYNEFMRSEFADKMNVRFK